MPEAYNLREHAPAVERRVAALGASRFIDRLFRGDASLWGRDPAARRIIRNRLGWLRAPERMLRLVPRLDAFAREVRQEGIRHVLLLGMGGSSLCVEVFARVFPAPPGFPVIAVLDSTVPSAVRRVEAGLDLSRTLVVVSSKSGATGETLALQAYFWARARRLLGRGAARRFAVITDPGTPLAEEASARGYRGVFLNPPDVGGRYSALSYFGLVPAALGGVEIGTLLRRAAAMLERCAPGAAAGGNPGLVLGAALGTILLPSLSKHHAGGASAAYSRLLDWGLRVTLLLALPAAAALAVLAMPLITTLFHYGRFSAEDAWMTREALVAYSLGLIGMILV
ncbi:MAG: lipid II flippase MurJ, partial [Acidobacteriota bacterium]